MWCVPRGCARGAGAREVMARRTRAFAQALRPLDGARPGPLLKRLMDAYGGMRAGVAREAFENACGGAWTRALARFVALCDWPRVEEPRLRETLRALADASEDGYWLPESLDGAVTAKLGRVKGFELDRMSPDQARAFFVYMVTQFDVDVGALTCTFEEFMTYFVHENAREHIEGELGEAYALFDCVKRIGVVAWQYLEMFDDPDIETFSSENTWIKRRDGGDVPRRGAAVSQSAQGAETMTIAIRAARLNRPREIERLVVEDGFDVNARDAANKRQSLLMIAAANGNKAACKKILILGADPYARDDTGRTAVDVANDYNHFVLAEYLNSHGVPTSTQLDSGAKELAAIERASFSISPRFRQHYERDMPYDSEITASAPPAPRARSSSPPRSPSSPTSRAWGDESELLTPE